MKRYLTNNGLLDSFASEQTKEVLASLGDITFAQAFDDGLLSQIPILGTALQVYGAAHTFQEHFAVAKLAAFLEKGQGVNQEEKEKFLAQLGDPKKADDLAIRLLVLVQKAEDLDKPKIYGNLFEACIKEYFDTETLTRLCKMVDRAFFEDFEYLKNLHHGEHQRRNQDIEQSLNAAGFLRQVGADEGVMGGEEGHIKFEVNSYGKWLIELGLSEGPIPDPETPNTLP